MSWKRLLWNLRRKILSRSGNNEEQFERKRKSKVKLTIATIVGVLLIIHACLEHKEADCLKEYEELQNNVSTQYFYSTRQTQLLFFLYTSLLIQNYTRMEIENKKASMHVEPRVRSFVGEYMNMTATTEESIRLLEKEIRDKRSSCNTISTISRGFLYAAQIVNLFFIVF